MIEIGQVVDGRKLGIKVKSKYIYARCIVCGNPRWTSFSVSKQKQRTDRCLSCSIKQMHEHNRLSIKPKGEPYVGEIRYGREIPSLKDHKHKYIFARCPECKKERWVSYRYNPNVFSRCQSCSAKAQVGENAPRWKGGRIKLSLGYVKVWVSKDDFFYPMADHTGYVLEHRLIVAKALGRCLLPWEIVHHKTGFAKDDNRYPETLELITDKRFHLVDMQVRAYIIRLEKRIEKLEGVLQLEKKEVR